MGEDTMDEQAFKNRTKKLALNVIRVVESLPRSRTADVIGRQLIRSGTSVGANYRAACRGRSTADVIAKLRIVEEEADESIYWMELLTEANIVSEESIAGMLKETDEILAMTVASIRTLQKRNGVSPLNRKSKIENQKST
jgi:four helix bundle protein